MISDIKSALELFTTFAQTPEMRSLKEYLLTIESAQSELRQKNSEIIQENTQLKEQIKKHDTWTQEKENYESFPTPSGATLYRKKDTEELFCPNCYETKMVAVHLQPSPNKEHLHRTYYKFCPNCKNTLRT